MIRFILYVSNKLFEIRYNPTRIDDLMGQDCGDDIIVRLINAVTEYLILFLPMAMDGSVRCDDLNARMGVLYPCQST